VPSDQSIEQTINIDQKCHGVLRATARLLEPFNVGCVPQEISKWPVK